VHDAWVTALTSYGVPDLIANVPTMVPPTLKLVQILPGKIGKSFAEATWNKIVDKLFSKSKGIVVKRVKRKLPNRFRNKYLYTTVDDMYEIIADELAKTIKETYINKAKF
jgi:hypothetical protein